jgi:hypothetical protein
MAALAQVSGETGMMGRRRLDIAVHGMAGQTVLIALNRMWN